MKLLLPLVLSLLLSSPSLFGQSVVLTNERMNVLYEGVDNPISVAVENTKDVSVEIDNGILIRSAPGQYIIQEARPGTALINIKKKTGNKITEIGTKKFRVKKLPLPSARVANMSGGEIERGALIVQQGIVAVMENFDFEARFVVTRFNVTIISNAKVMFNKDITGNRFDNDVYDAFRKLSVGDRVLFNNIYCVGPDKKERLLQPIEFTIIP